MPPTVLAPVQPTDGDGDVSEALSHIGEAAEPASCPDRGRPDDGFRVRTDKFLARRQNSRRSEPSRLPNASLRCDLLVRPTILLDLRSGMRRLIRIFRGINSE